MQNSLNHLRLSRVILPMNMTRGSISVIGEANLISYLFLFCRLSGLIDRSCCMIISCSDAHGVPEMMKYPI